MTEGFLRRWSRLKQSAVPPGPDPAAAYGQTPDQLAQAALRLVWRTDPVISGFVEVADNQWDFNDPAALPGFGPLPAGPAAQASAAPVPAARGEPSPPSPAIPPATPPALSPPALSPPALPPRGQVDAVWLPPAGPEPAPPGRPAPAPARRRRTGSHGGAMPAEA